MTYLSRADFYKVCRYPAVVYVHTSICYVYKHNVCVLYGIHESTSWGFIHTQKHKVQFRNKIFDLTYLKDQ